MPQVAGVVRVFAEGAGKERRAGAGELPWDVGLHTMCPVEAGRRRALLYILSAVHTCPATRARAPEGQREKERMVKGIAHLKMM